MFKIALTNIFIAIALSGCAADCRLWRHSEPAEPSPPIGAVQSDFYDHFCEAMRRRVRGDEDFGVCDEYIVKPPPVTLVASKSPMPGWESRTTLVFVPGIFGQCVADMVTPFSDDYARLRNVGYEVIVVPVEGRSSSEHNAEIIDRFLTARNETGRQMVVVGYSKGATDFMVALAEHPQAGWAKHTRAFVSLAGVVAGTPLADKYSSLYSRLLRKVPLSACPPGDGGAITSLTSIARQPWLQHHQLPTTIRYYSVAAVSKRSTVNPLLHLFYNKLAANHLPNDGQVSPDATSLPKGEPLALLRGDHWSITLPFETAADVRAKLFSINNHFPRAALIDTLLLEIASNVPER